MYIWLRWYGAIIINHLWSILCKTLKRHWRQSVSSAVPNVLCFIISFTTPLESECYSFTRPSLDLPCKVWLSGRIMSVFVKTELWFGCQHTTTQLYECHSYAFYSLNVKICICVKCFFFCVSLNMGLLEIWSNKYR